MKQQPAQLLMSIAQEIVDKDAQARKQGRKDDYFNCQIAYLTRLMATGAFRRRIQNTPNPRLHRYNIALHFNPTTNIRGNNNSVANNQDKSQRAHNKDRVDENHDRSRRSYELARPSKNPETSELRHEIPTVKPWKETRGSYSEKPQAKKSDCVNDTKPERNYRGPSRAGNNKRRGGQRGKSTESPKIKPPQAPAPKNARQQPEQYLGLKVNLPTQPATQQQQTQLGFTRDGVDLYAQWRNNNRDWAKQGQSQVGQFNYPQPAPTPLQQIHKPLVKKIGNNNGPKQQTSSRQLPKQKCFVCGKPGHWQRDCRHNPRRGTRK